jgi:hypothetical protein
MAPHLLSLSGEIRKTIYEYTLTKDDSVCYRENAHGIGWLCTYRIGNDITSDLGFEEDDSDDKLLSRSRKAMPAIWKEIAEVVASRTNAPRLNPRNPKVWQLSSPKPTSL